MEEGVLGSVNTSLAAISHLPGLSLSRVRGYLIQLCLLALAPKFLVEQYPAPPNANTDESSFVSEYPRSCSCIL